MIPSLRRRFNQAWSPEKYARFLAAAGSAVRRTGPQFRHSETPCFLPADLIDRMARYGREMVEQLLANPRVPARLARGNSGRVSRAQRRSRSALRAGGFRAGRRICDPKLVEIQGFPSLYAYQP